MDKFLIACKNCLDSLQSVTLQLGVSTNDPISSKRGELTKFLEQYLNYHLEAIETSKTIDEVMPEGFQKHLQLCIDDVVVKMNSELMKQSMLAF